MKDKVQRSCQKEQEKEKRLKKNEEELRELQDNIKCNNVHIIGISEGEDDDQGIEHLIQKLVTGNFPILIGEKVTQIQEARS